MKEGRLFVVSGPSGAGKSTVTKLVRKKLDMPLAVSATTRKARKGEIDTVDYHFITMEEFQTGIKNGDFLEYANVHGNYYGTLKKEVDRKVAAGEDVILEIDVQGGIQIREKFKDAKLIFFKAPNEEILAERLKGRATDDAEVIKKRLENSLEELKYEEKYDVTIVNHTVDQSVEELISVIKES